MKKKENNIILFGIAITVLASAGFTISQGTAFLKMISMKLLNL